MKHITLIFWTLFSLSLQAQYQLEWADEFNGTTLDTKFWNVEKGGGSAWNNTAVDDPSVIEVSNGSLKLKAIKNPNSNANLATVQTIDKNTVWTGAVDTHKKIGFKYGKLEVRARIESAPRAWPAIWLMPTYSVYGGNPLSGEIDMVEHLNYDKTFYTTVHTEYHLTNKNDPERYGLGTFTNDDNEWVIYGMEWTEQKIDFFRNGVLYHTVNKGAGIYVNGLLRWPFDEEFYIILSQQIGGGWVDGEAASKGLVLKDSDLPLTMEIDYVRLYKKSTQTINYDLAANNLIRTNQNTCGTSVDLDFEVTNNGSQTITSFDVEVFVGNQVITKQNKTANLSAGGNATFSITGLNTQISGNNNLKIIVSNPNGNLDEISSNDEASVNITTNEGELHEFVISKDQIGLNLEWEIKDGNTIVLTNADASITTNGTDQIQSFCLPAGCYEITVSDAFKIVGTCNTNQWSSSVNYCLGDQVSINGTLYEAKWCGTGNNPATAGQWGQWSNLGACAPAAAGSYSVRKSGGANYFSVSEDVYSSPETTSFCTEGQGSNVDFTVSSKTATNCEDVIFTSLANPVGTTYNWDFGQDATPASAIGIGPHTVTYSSTGSKTTSLRVDGIIQTKTNHLTITDGKITPTINIQLKNESFPVCIDTIATYTASTSQTGNATIKWFINGIEEAEGDTINVENINGNTIQAKVVSDLACAFGEESESNTLTAQVIDCATNNNQIDGSNLNIYPNPVGNFLFIKGTLVEKAEVFNSLGMLVYTDSDRIQNEPINLHFLSTGSYFVKIYTADGVATKAFYKK